MMVIGLVHEEPEATEWKELCVGAERCIKCEHIQA